MANFGIYETSFAFGNFYLRVKDLREKIYKLAELENSTYRLRREMITTQKRANALEKIQIPKYESAIKKIENILEEKQREEFFRLKKLKK